MKKIILIFASLLLSVLLIQAQNDCMEFFPTEEGTVLINKTYDAGNNLLSTMTYRVNRSNDYFSGSSIQIGFVMTDRNNKVIDDGNLSAQCDGGTFYLSMANRAINSDVMDVLGNNTEIISNFLDYPDTFNNDYPFSGDFKMDGGQFTVRSKTDKKEYITVRMYDRNYIKNEKITTPAGTFDAAKITYIVEIVKDKKSETCSGAEWYATGAGIVRTETYDKAGKLQNYTELATLRKK